MTGQLQMFSSELQFISTTTKTFNLERFAIYSVIFKPGICHTKVDACGPICNILLWHMPSINACLGLNSSSWGNNETPSNILGTINKYYLSPQFAYIDHVPSPSLLYTATKLMLLQITAKRILSHTGE